MNLKPGRKQELRVLLNPRDQTPEKLNEIMTALLGHAGCHMCGRMIKLNVEFAGDPGPESAHAGVISVTEF